MAAIMAPELASTGSAETSRFQGLSVGKTAQPATVAGVALTVPGGSVELPGASGVPAGGGAGAPGAGAGESAACGSWAPPSIEAPHPGATSPTTSNATASRWRPCLLMLQVY